MTSPTKLWLHEQNKHQTLTFHRAYVVYVLFLSLYFDLYEVFSDGLRPWISLEPKPAY